MPGAGARFSAALHMPVNGSYNGAFEADAAVFRGPFAFCLPVRLRMPGGLLEHPYQFGFEGERINQQGFLAR